MNMSWGLIQKLITNRKGVGQRGENEAIDYLRSRGYDIRERNFRNKWGRQLGEIDIIAEKNSQIIFCEVKARQVMAGKVTLPEENITPSKIRKLERIANFYIRKNNLWDKSFYFDAISVEFVPGSKRATIRHLEHIF
jgi:putative endonuclease